MLKLIKGFVLGRSWWLIGGAMFLSALASGSLVWMVSDWRATNKVAQVQHLFDEYKLQVAQSVASENAQVALTLRELSKSLKTFQIEMQKQKKESETFSDNLIKELYDANGKSCPLSPAIKHYLDSLRQHQRAGRN